MENEEQTTELENQNSDNVGQDEKENIQKQNQKDGSDGQDDSDNVGQDEKELYGAPENYDFKKIDMPEGIQFNEEYGNKFSAVAKELNLSQNSANKLVNLYLGILKEQAASAPEKIKEFKEQQLQTDIMKWDRAFRQDAEFGNGNQEKIKAYMEKANEGYKAFASDGLQDILKEKGLNHHPEVIKLFYKLSDLTGEDKILMGGKATKEESPAEILYGNSK